MSPAPDQPRTGEDRLAPGGAHRPASVNLRGSGPEGPGDSLDPANQSLADALRIVSGILSVTMAVLALLFALSGFQSIQEGERGISLLFGKVTARDLKPGFQFSFPRPLGELIRVSTGAQQKEIDSAFWPYMTDSEKRQSVEQLVAKPSLNPRMDGSLITSDEALAHTRWTVVYSRADIEAYARNIMPEQEEAIVRAAVERGIVQAVAQTRIDSLLKQSSDEKGSVASTAARIAQATLDEMESGLHIDQLQLLAKMPPIRVRDKFSEVQSAESKAAQARQDALAERDRILNNVAGGAAPYLAEQIDRYEEAIASDDPAAQEDILRAINDLLEGSPTTVTRADGSTEAVGNIVSGEVTSILADAFQYRSSIAGQTQAQYAEFKGKLEQFNINPLVMVNRDWSDAFARFLDRPNVQITWVPPGVAVLDIMINPDPDLVKEQLRYENQQKALASDQAREQRRIEEKNRVDTNLRVVPGN